MQSLYGYRALDAGFILAPGAFLLTLVAPIGAQLIQRGLVSPRILLFGAVLVVGIALIHFSHFNLQTDYRHYALARCLQALGYAFFFVPLSVIAYSQLDPTQNDQASALTNLIRNWGGSFGIATVTTMSERRQNYHQTTVGANLSASSPSLQHAVQQTAAYLQTRGVSQSDASKAAYAHYYDQLLSQTRLLASMDCFHILGVVTLIAAPLVLLTKTFKSGVKAPGDH
jgi:DHA2 family multidrug resistance protein